MSFRVPHVGFPSRQTFSPFRGLFQNSRGSKFIATGWLLGSSLMTGIATGFYVWITGSKDRHIGDLKCIKMYSIWSNDSRTSWNLFFFKLSPSETRSNALQTPWIMMLICSVVQLWTIPHPSLHTDVWGIDCPQKSPEHIPRLVAKCSRSLDVRLPSFRRRKKHGLHMSSLECISRKGIQ